MLDFASDVSRDSACDAATSVGSRSTVHASHLVRVAVEAAQIYKSVLSDCAVQGSILGNVHANHAILLRSFISDTTVIHAQLDNVTVRGFAGQQPLIENVSLADLTIDGPTILRGGWVLQGAYYFHGGVWEQRPRAMELSTETGIRLGLIECFEHGKVHVGCYCHAVSKWLRSGPVLGRKLGYAEADIAFIRLFIESLLDEKRVAA